MLPHSILTPHPCLRLAALVAGEQTAHPPSLPAACGTMHGMKPTYDIIIIGLGGMGSAAAYHAARRGQCVLGIERHTLAHTLGSSHGRSCIIRQAYFEDQAYVPLLLCAYELWRQIEHDSGTHLLTITGGLMIGLHRYGDWW